MKMKKYLFMSAVLFTAAIGFTACSSEDDLAGAEEDRGVVKADFTISFPQQMGGFTRQSEAVVQGQATPVFRGIQDIVLLPFNVAKTSISASTTTPSSISLLGGTVGKTGASGETANVIAGGTSALYGGSKSHLYKDIEIAIGTRAFMFYGVAINETAADADAVNGCLIKTTGTTLDDINFSLKPIFTGTVLNAEAEAIAAYMTGIANASSGTETMLAYFPNFTSLRPGSWNSAKAAVQQIYTSIYSKTDALSVAIKAAILDTYTISGSAVTFATDTSTDGTLTFSTAYSYPANINLPDGAAYLSWNDTNKEFVPLTNDNMGLNISTLGNYVYPASLYYFGLSSILTTTQSMESAYNETDTWAQILAKYTAAEAQSLVQSNTRSIAIVDEVQYAVGRLDVSVGAAGGTLTDKENTAIPLMTGATANFPITSIIVANQKAVDYKFETAGATAYTIYDNQITGGYLYPGSTPDYKTHTLVLQTEDAENIDGNGDNDPLANVSIAVEFENRSGKTIVGKDNQLIYPNTKFYLVGVLKPDANTTQRYSTATDSPLIKKAFVQDYVTTANFTVNSFQNAYNCLPDLRVPHLEIGMSVDLNWKSGITQSIIIN